MKSFLLVVWDGDRMRAFHPPVMDPFDRQMVEEFLLALIRLKHGQLPTLVLPIIPLHVL